MPERDTTPTEPTEKMLPGMMPILHWFGVRTPGQLGPISRDLEPASERFTLTMSCTGMPSVMQMIRGISASMASMMESAANGGGTYTTEAVAPVAWTASSTVSNTGTPTWVMPPLPGVTPPTILVP